MKPTVAGAVSVDPEDRVGPIGPWYLGVIENKFTEKKKEIVTNAQDTTFGVYSLIFICEDGKYSIALSKYNSTENLFGDREQAIVDYRIDKGEITTVTGIALIKNAMFLTKQVPIELLFGRGEISFRIGRINGTEEQSSFSLLSSKEALGKMASHCTPSD